jgi:hypothetical protein
MSTETFSHDVFLSHSAKDKAVVPPVAERLWVDGLQVWFDEGKPIKGSSASSSSREETQVP